MRRTDLFALGIMIAGAALKYLFDSTPMAFVGLAVGVALITIGHMRRDEHDFPFEPTPSLGLLVPETQPSVLPSKIDVHLIPSSGPSPEVTLAVLNRADEREFSAQCTLQALRNSPNELSRKTFDLKWEHTFDRKISIAKGESQNLLIATADQNHKEGFSGLTIWGLSGNRKSQCEGSRWNFTPSEALPEYDLEITIVSTGAEPYSQQFTLRPRTWHGPLEMINING